MTQLAMLRRACVAAVLFAFSSYALVLPMLGQPPECGEQWTVTGDCEQTTQFTCSPASAATLLQMHGIAASERELAELCLTRHGTSWLGLYRGLKLKTQGTKWDVAIVRCPVEEIDRHAGSPMIVEVGLDAGAPIDATFRSEFGWVPGLRHSVILTEFKEHQAKIVDPTPHIGREDWDEKTLRLLWRGYGLRLVERK